jgi:fucose permease
MTGSNALLIATLSSAFFAGVLLGLLRNLKAALAEHLGTTERRVQRLRAVFSLLLVPMMLVSGLLIDKWGLQPVLIAGSLLAGLGISALEPIHGDRPALPGVLLAAAGAAALAVAGLVLMPRAYAPRNVTAAVNLGCVAFALGVLLTPGLMGWLTRRGGFRRALVMLALACLTPAACLMFVAPNELDSPQAVGDLGGVLHYPGLWLAALVLLLYQPVEEALSGLMRRGLKELQLPEHRVSLWAGLLWLSFLGSRLLTGLVVGTGYEVWLVLFAVALAAVTLGNLIGNYRPVSGGLSLMLAAACLAPVFPTTLGLVLGSFPHDQGVACGLVMAGSSLGVLVFPSLIHPASDRHGPRTAMWLALHFTLLLLGAALVLAVVW